MAAANVMVVGTMPQLLRGRTIGGVMFNTDGAGTDFRKLQFEMISIIVLFKLVFLVIAEFGMMLWLWFCKLQVAA